MASVSQSGDAISALRKRYFDRSAGTTTERTKNADDDAHPLASCWSIWFNRSQGGIVRLDLKRQRTGRSFCG